MLTAALSYLIQGMDDEIGVNFTTYNGILYLIKGIYGQKGVDIFILSVKVTEGRYYLPSNVSSQLLEDIASTSSM